MKIIVNENDPTDVKILTDDGIDLVKKLSIRRVEVKLEPNEFPKVIIEVNPLGLKVDAKGSNKEIVAKVDKNDPD